eukprot:352507-Chlamydomonas_euryale.AAC.14
MQSPAALGGLVQIRRVLQIRAAACRRRGRLFLPPHDGMPQPKGLWGALGHEPRAGRCLSSNCEKVTRIHV